VNGAWVNDGHNSQNPKQGAQSSPHKHPDSENSANSVNSDPKGAMVVKIPKIQKQGAQSSLHKHPDSENSKIL
jgi:hypothetical protein